MMVPEDFFLSSGLEQFGWYPHRVIDLSEILINLKERNYQISKPFERLMEEFGGLEFHFSEARKVFSLSFSIESASNYAFDGEIQNYYSKLIGAGPLTLIGSINNSQPLVISGNGEIYSLFDALVFYWGNEKEGIKNILSDSKPQVFSIT